MIYNMGQVEQASGGAKLEKPSKFSVEFSTDISLSVLLNVSVTQHGYCQDCFTFSYFLKISVSRASLG